MEEAFQFLKLRFATPPVLAFPDFDRPFFFQTSASFFSFDALLAQKKEDGKVHPVQCTSRTMSSSEKKYAACERETLGVTFALEKFRVYLLSCTAPNFSTDHQALPHAF